LKLLIEDAAPAAILADAAAAAKLPGSEASLLLVRSDAHEVEATLAEPAPEENGPTPDDVAYVLYTSGSTGRPKAVEIRHRSVVNLLEAMRRDLRFGADDRVLAVTTVSFDIAALELFLPLVCGAQLVIATRDEAADPARLATLMDRCAPTLMQATPATWRALVQRGWVGEPRLKVLCGGEALSRDLADRLMERAAEVWNLYGPTETTIWSLSQRLERSGETVPIGRPLANTRAYVLDRGGAPVPDLVSGELVIAGDGLARGYRNDQALTETKFVTSALLAGERLYRTGDRARFRPDGLIEFLGRADNQVKIRGFRVGLEEVESAIGRHPWVAACAVRALPDASGELGLVAYLAGAHLEGDGAAVRDFLRRELPDYMVPGRYVVLPALPTTTNGKIDRERLPEPTVAEPIGPSPVRDPTEAVLVELWKEVLGLPAIGLDDNFFDLGGHSLLAALLMAKIQTRLGRELPLAALFEAPTVAALAALLISDEAPGFSHLVRLAVGGAAPPLFIVHGVFGNVLQFIDLAAQVGGARPIYGVQARGADPRQEPHASIAEMVDAYAAAIRRRQPAGPYALAGYSFGGLVAFELARRFRAEGETVDILALLETELPSSLLPPAERLAYAIALPARIVGKLRSLPRGSVGSYLARKLAELCRSVPSKIGLSEGRPPSGLPTGPLAERGRRMYRVGLREFRRYRPQPYDGPVSLFQVVGPRFHACDPTPIWRRVARSVEVFEIDGRHDIIMERPYVGALAARLRDCLRRNGAAVAPEPRDRCAKSAKRSGGIAASRTRG
ncbi:MAG: amino acid adenylation domain-containing protein, partial [Caulobacteraceae bacterium]